MSIKYTASYNGQYWPCQLSIISQGKDYILAEAAARGTYLTICFMRYRFGCYCICIPENNAGCALYEDLEYNFEQLEAVESNPIDRATLAYAVNEMFRLI